MATTIAIHLNHVTASGGTMFMCIAILAARAFFLFPPGQLGCWRSCFSHFEKNMQCAFRGISKVLLIANQSHNLKLQSGWLVNDL
jgi:hypothetical protein